MRCRVRYSFLFMVMLATGMPRYVTAAQTPPVSGATPSASSISFVLLTEEQVPNGLAIIEDGERTLEDVASGFSQPDATNEQFMVWGWQGNVIRAFHTSPEVSTDPNQIDGIYISVHEFGSPAFAAAALDYSFETHATDTSLEEIPPESLGEYSRSLYGKQSYGNEVTLYVQQGNYLIRLSASSPKGDPTVEATHLVQMMLDVPPATPTATLPT